MRKAVDYFKRDGLLSNVFKDYKPRQSQYEFADAMHRAIENGVPFIGEAETGVGKSLAALSAAASAIEKNGDPVLVVTSSILLQEQYLHKDIPIIEKATGKDFSPLILMGKANYICPLKAMKMDRNLKLGSIGSSTDDKQAASVLDWFAKTKTGELSELHFDLTKKVSEECTIVNENECEGKRCPMYRNCPYFNKKNQIPISKIMVCNYHYFLTGLEVDSSMLPARIGTVILDEVHEMENIIREVNAIKFSSDMFKKEVENLAEVSKLASQTSLRNINIGESLEIADFINQHYVVFDKLTRYYHSNKGDTEHLTLERRRDNEVIDILNNHIDDFEKFLINMDSYLFETLGIDTDLLFGTDYYSETFSGEHEEIFIKLVKFNNYMYKKSGELKEMFFSINEDNNFLVWLEPPDNVNKLYVEMRAKVKKVADLAQPILAKGGKNKNECIEDSNVLAMSATLTSDGNFNHIRTTLGINKEYVEEKKSNSPFDMSQNMMWYLPVDIPAGNEKGHDMKALDTMIRFIDELNGKVLCLFTSTEKMNQAGRIFRNSFSNRDISILVQGDMTKKKMVETMRENDNVVIVATKSFFTGVDIPGPNLRAVLLDKLPFPMSADPINEFLMSQDRGFYRHNLPQTIIAIKQAFGRLIRTDSDIGVVSILDNRLATSSYKNIIFRSFAFKLNATRDIEKAIEHAKK